MAAETERERIKIVKHVGSELLDGLGQPPIRQADPVFGVQGEREAGDVDHRDGTVGAPRGLGTEDQDIVAEAGQVPDQVQGAIDDAVDLGQEDFRNNGDAHDGSPRTMLFRTGGTTAETAVPRWCVRVPRLSPPCPVPSAGECGYRFLFWARVISMLWWSWTGKKNQFISQRVIRPALCRPTVSTKGVSQPPR